LSGLFGILDLFHLITVYIVLFHLMPSFAGIAVAIVTTCTTSAANSSQHLKLLLGRHAYAIVSAAILCIGS
jgi:hypothetical protein